MIQQGVRMNKIKIAWICHFTNPEIQSKLPVRRRINEFSSWIPNMLKGYENRDDFEIHVIAPHDLLKKQTSLVLRNIHYHFIPYGIPIWHRHWPAVFPLDVYLNYHTLRKNIKKTIGKIQPDLINLIGAENPYYSSSILDLATSYPILITIQGFISQMRGSVKEPPWIKKSMEVEEKILRTFKYFAGEQDSSTYISKYNPGHTFKKLYFPVNEIFDTSTFDKKTTYDCLYFGRLEKIKGAEDFVKIIAEIKKKRPGVKGCMIGGGKLIPLKKLAAELNCSDNIEFAGFIETQYELFEYVKASRVFLAPPYFERLSSTIREAMMMKTPIVAYATGGIPYINEFDENIYLVKTGDYLEMARKTLLLLENESIRKNLAEKGYQYFKKEFSEDVNTERTISAYMSIIKDYLHQQEHEL